MRKEIIKEELGISNDVKQIVSLIKSSIGDNFSKFCKDPSRYSILHQNFQYKVFNGNISVKWKNIVINVKYYVLPDAEKDVIDTYLRYFSSTSNTKDFILTFFLISEEQKIVWGVSDGTIQHETEHLFQLYKKGKPLLNLKQSQKYNDFISLTKSDDYTEKIIGFTYYYYTKVEKNALINGLYGRIMGLNIEGYRVDPLDEIQKSMIYRNIKLIKDFIENVNNHDVLSNKLSKYNKELNSFLKISNTVVSGYIKAFGRLLYLLKKEINESNKDILVNLSDVLI